MNKTFLQKLRDFFCCCPRESIGSSDEFKNTEFSLDMEYESQSEKTCSSGTANLTQETSRENDEEKDVKEKEKEKENVRDVKDQENDVKEKDQEKQNEMKEYVYRKLDIRHSEVENATKRSKLKKMAEDERSNSMTVNELNEIISTEEKEKKEIKEPEEQNGHNERIRRLERVLSSIKDIEGIKKKEEEETQVMSLRSKKTETEPSASNSCTSLSNFVRTAEDDSTKSEATDSDVTCFINHYSTKEYSKSLAKKMERHLKKSQGKKK
ncbi:hypothetical protein ECANGB1_137 [Enterospora canceri]|uniref:Uncharacterized protein n=1 Tax=Enterospora canceri TaxID=1081671 RepID=A0A1Y1S9H4_9MICR|nr:hypothetical protein ECANGB1_137 [Enterospora canceri]